MSKKTTKRYMVVDSGGSIDSIHEAWADAKENAYDGCMILEISKQIEVSYTNTFKEVAIGKDLDE